MIRARARLPGSNRRPVARDPPGAHLVRVREDGKTASWHYRCRHCAKAAIRVEPYKEDT